MPLKFGREITGDLCLLETREWLVTNGIGGYASGSAAGSLTRGYHGLLVASLSPPVDRRVMLVKLDETVTYCGSTYDLATNRWAGGAVSPEGFKNLQSFHLEGSIPVWTFACGDALIEKRIWMQDRANTTFIEYIVVAAAEEVTISARAITDNRNFHNTGQVAWPATIELLPDGFKVVASEAGARNLIVRTSCGEFTPDPDLYRNFYLPAEAARGMRDLDDHVHAGTFLATIGVASSLQVLASAEDDPAFDANALRKRKALDESILTAWQNNRMPGIPQAPEWIHQYVLASDQFIVDRASPERPNGKSIIAGYHWFDDWGRDTMISLPGLTLVTGRAPLAETILRTFAQFISDGMLPNRFPGVGDVPEYNTIDAALWYFQAIVAYYQATEDDSLLADLYPLLEGIVDCHVTGTRYGIRVDPADGLLRGGEKGVQLTWMDAKVDDLVVTPRIGKPVEVNALWLNALTTMTALSEKLKRPAGKYKKLANAALAGFERFWNPETGFCFDVLDGPDGNDSSLRPNQLLVVSLPNGPFSKQREAAILAASAKSLLTSYGLRSLNTSNESFVGVYSGSRFQRDSAYHQGTTWAWLIGPFIDAHLKVFKDPAAAMRILAPFAEHLHAAGLGTASEIMDGDPPFTPKGCIAQAWSVAEILRAFDKIERFGSLSHP